MASIFVKEEFSRRSVR